MTTDLMEVYSLEEGDTIVYRGDLFRFTGHTQGRVDGGIDLKCVDEEGELRWISVPDDFYRVKILCDIEHTV